MPRPRKRSELENQLQVLASSFIESIITSVRAAPVSEFIALGTVAAVPVPAPANGAPAKPRRTINFSKCQWPGCEKNRSPRTSPYCGEHYAEARAEKAALEKQEAEAAKEAAADVLAPKRRKGKKRKKS
jgi:hypothetical protein